jgi:beta-lactamase class A
MSLIAFLALLSPPQTCGIEARLAEIEVASKGKLGAAIVSAESAHYSRKVERFSLQSVMKLIVSMAALDQVDQGKWKLNQKFVFRRSDLSLSRQPIVERLGKRDSIIVSVADCIELTVTQSCSASGDFLVRKMGGVGVVNAFLKRRGIAGMSVDRQERDLQTQIGGIVWRPQYVDEAKIDAALRRVTEEAKDAAYRKYQADSRDTTTPGAMAMLLQKLVTGKLLSASSTRYLMGVMERTATGPDRLRAGVPKGWTLGNKTGTSGSRNGVACATNDVGFVRGPKGEWLVIVAMLRNSTLDDDGRAAILRRVAETAFVDDKH